MSPKLTPLALVLGFALIIPQHLRAAEPTEAPHIGEGGVPQFEREKSWVKKIPAAWTNGAVSAGVTVDEKNHVWLLTRPNALPAGPPVHGVMMPGADKSKPVPQAPPHGAEPASRLPASAIPPSVIEFDEAGNILQSWGGKSGKGYVWPHIEHGIAPGPNGSLMIVGYKNVKNFSLETQLLTFTKTGKFVSAVGKADVAPGSNKLDAFNGPTGAAYHAKTNEIFVADGYGNNRIVVLDAATGKIKRMWGAYGEKPLDAADRPPLPVPPLLPVGMPWKGVIDAARQFKDLHDIKVSKDGLVYAPDRGNRRVQVFTLEGKFVAEQALGLDSPYELHALSLDFSPDQRFLYVAGTPVIRILNRKTLEVLETKDIDGMAHHMAVDGKGNIFIALESNVDPDGKPYGLGIQKFAFKGYSPQIK